VVGQEAVVSVLKKSLTEGKLHHAYLFSGARGTGKTSVARILAHKANDFKYELEAVHPDIIEIDAASNTGVDNIRELIERAALAPTSGKHKIYIIDEVHMLSKSAFNALLKTLEEPPSAVIFILATTDPEKVPLTILSRVQHLKFKLAEVMVLVRHLRNVANQEKLKISDEALTFLAESSGGSFRDALSLLEQAQAVCGGKTEITREALETAFGVPSGESMSELVQAFSQGDADAVMRILDRGIDNKKAFIEGLTRQILKTPTAETLGLLNDLISTLRNPAIDLVLQIRVAFLGRMPLEPPSVKTEAVKVIPTTQEPKVELVAKPEPTTTPEPAEPEVAEVTNGESLSWEEVLMEVKRSDIGLWAVLAKRRTEVSDKEVLVYAEKQLWADKLEKPEAFRKLSRLIAPRKLRISLEKAPPSAEALKVSAKIGVDVSELKEVEVPDGI